MIGQRLGARWRRIDSRLPGQHVGAVFGVSLVLASLLLARWSRRDRPRAQPSTASTARVDPETDSRFEPVSTPTEDETPASITGWLSSAIIRARLVVIAAWIVGAILITLFLTTPREAATGLIPTDIDAITTRERLLEDFTVPLGSPVVVVQRDPDGLTLDAQRRVFERVTINEETDGWLEGLRGVLPVTNSAAFLPGSREVSTSALSFLFFDRSSTIFEQWKFAHWFTDRHVNQSEDALVGVTGLVPARFEQWREIEDALPLVTLATLALIAFILIWHFRAIGPPLVALASAGIAFLIALRLSAWLGETLGLSAPQEVEPVVVALLLGIVTDYAIFMLSGFRRRLARGDDRLTAARGATATNLPIIFTAGLIVAAGSLALLAGTLGFFRSFGPGLALTAIVGVAVSITFIPATMAVFGRVLFWPSLTRGEGGAAESGVSVSHARAWIGRKLGTVVSPVDRIAKLGFLTTSRPGSFIVAGLACLLLVAAGTGIFRTTLGFTEIQGLPRSNEARQAAEAAWDGFADGMLAPTILLLEEERIGSRVEQLLRLESLLESEPGVATVLGPREIPSGLLEETVIAPSQNSARLGIVLEHEPLGGEAIEALQALESRTPDLLQEAGLVETRASFSGETALADDTIGSLLGDLARIAIAVIIINLLFLALLLRSVVAPLYLLITSILSLTASLGLATFVFQDLLGHGEMTYYIPFAAAVLLVSLGSDYNVFLVGRIWQEASEAPLDEAVRRIVPRASRAIRAAGLALAGSFGLLALIPLRPFREFAFVMGAGILLETFFVRSLLVPALVVSFGRLNRWPGRPRPSAPEPQPDASPSGSVA